MKNQKRVGLMFQKHNSRLVLIILILSTLVPGNSKADVLHIHERMMLSKYIASNRNHVNMIIAVKEDGQHNFTDFIKQKNIIIRYMDRQLGYYRLRVPIDSVMEISNHPSILAVNLMPSSWPYIQFSPKAPDHARRPNFTPLLNVYKYLSAAEADDPINGVDEMGVLRLRKKYPTYDGRGVTIAVIEMMPDMTAPELSTAKTLDGAFIPKYRNAYAIAASDPNDPDSEIPQSYGGIHLKGNYEVKDKHLKLGDKKIVVPEPGVYKIAILDEVKTVGHGADLNKDGNPGHKQRDFFIVQKVGEECLLIDINQNNDLRDDACIADYNVASEVHRFASEGGATVGTPFIVLKTEHPDIWVLGLPWGHTHDTHLAAAGDQLFGSKLTAPAPAASLLPIFVPPWLQGASIEAVILAARQPSVDVILLERASVHSFAHSQTVTTLILDRIVRRLNKVIVAPAGNVLSMAAVIGHEASATNVIAVGQYYSGTTQDLMFGRKGSQPITAAYSSGGPRDDGRLKPDVVAPSLGVFPVSQGFDTTSDNSEANALHCPNIVPLSGVTCYTGTSMAAPVAAGAAAVLISAAKQENIPYSALDIYKAVTMSARHIPGEPVYKQGNGLIDVQAALEWLRRKVDEPQLEFDIKAPVRTKLSHDLPNPNRGDGLYEREGWVPGMRGVRYITIRRSSGSREAGKFQLSVIGDTYGTFKTPMEVALPLGKDVRVPVHIAPREHGVHSAILQIGSSKTPLARVALTVIAAMPLNAKNGYQAIIEDVNRPGRLSSFYVQVPPGAIAIRAYHEPPFIGDYPSFIPPTGGYYNFPGVSEEIVAKASESISPSPANEQSEYFPSPGVWEYQVPDVFIESSKPTRIRTKFQAVMPETIAKRSIPKASKRRHRPDFALAAGTTYYRKILGKKVTGTVQLGLSDLPALINLDVPANVEQLDIVAKTLSASDAPPQVLTVMAFECQSDQCNAKGIATGDRQAGFVVYRARPGNWQLAIDTSRLKTGTTTVEYQVFTTLKYGSTEYGEGEDLVKERKLHKEKKLSQLENPIQCYMELISERFVAVRYQQAIDSRINFADQQTFIPLRRVPWTNDGTEDYVKNNSVVSKKVQNESIICQGGSVKWDRAYGRSVHIEMGAEE